MENCEILRIFVFCKQTLYKRNNLCEITQPFTRSVISWLKSRTTDTQKLNLKFFVAQIQIPIPNKYLGVGYKGLVFCRNNGWIMENMAKDLSVPKWVLIVQPKIPHMPQKNFSPKCLRKPKSSRFLKKSSLWMSVLRH